MTLKNHSIYFALTVAAFSLFLNACFQKEQTDDKANNLNLAISSTLEESNDNKSTEPLPEYLEKLQWVNSADAHQDVTDAIANNDYAFWVLATRAPVAPGLDQETHSSLLTKCGEKYLQGVGDTLFDSDHRTLHKRAIDYATAYNQTLLSHCKTR